MSQSPAPAPPLNALSAGERFQRSLPYVVGVAILALVSGGVPFIQGWDERYRVEPLKTQIERLKQDTAARIARARQDSTTIEGLRAQVAILQSTLSAERARGAAVVAGLRQDPRVRMQSRLDSLRARYGGDLAGYFAMPPVPASDCTLELRRKRAEAEQVLHEMRDLARQLRSARDLEFTEAEYARASGTHIAGWGSKQSADPGC